MARSDHTCFEAVASQLIRIVFRRIHPRQNVGAFCDILVKTE